MSVDWQIITVKIADVHLGNIWGYGRHDPITDCTVLE